MDYLDFELAIAHLTGTEYRVTARSDAGGEPEVKVSIRSDTIAQGRRILETELLASSRVPRHAKPAEPTPMVDGFGTTLFDTVMQDDIETSYRVCLAEARRQKKGVRVRLRTAPELSSLPWEFMYDTKERGYLALSAETLLVRHLGVARAKEALDDFAPPLRILVMVASPKDQRPLDKELETQRLTDAIQELPQGLVELTWVDKGTYKALADALDRGPWHVFHFIGHGEFTSTSKEGVLVLENDEQNSHRVSATDLSQLLKPHRSLQLAVLNSCEGATASESEAFSSTAAMLVHSGVPAVVAMQHEVTNDAAIEFSYAFYESIAKRIPVDGALAKARSVMKQKVGNFEWGTPVLFMRSPTGDLFSRPGDDTDTEIPETHLPTKVLARRRMGAVLLVLATVVALGALATIRAGSTGIRFIGQVEGLSFVVSEPVTLSPVNLSQLAVGSAGSMGDGQPESDRILVPIDGSTITFPGGDGSVELEPNTAVSILRSGPGEYQLRIVSAAPRVPVSVRGQIRVLDFIGGLKRVLEHEAPFPIQVYPDPSGALEVTLTTADSAQLFSDGFLVDSVELFRIDAFGSPDGTPEVVSTIQKGTLEVGSVKGEQFPPNRELRFGRSSGTLVLRLGEFMTADLSGTVSGIQVGPTGNLENGMPSLLDVWQNRFSFLGGLTVYLVGLLFVVWRWWRKPT